jgi:hypothetical protein
MASVMIFDFGRKDDVQTYRVTGMKDDLMNMLKEVLNAGGEFKSGVPKIEHVHNGNYTLLLELKLESVGAGAHGKRRKNKTANAKGVG